MSKALWLNALGFQCVWWALALGVPRGLGVLSAVVALAYVIWQWQQAEDRESHMLSMLACVISGFFADMALGIVGGVHFMPTNPAPFEALQPWWLTLLWMSLGCTLHSSLQWLCNWPMLSVGFSAIAGVASYQAAVEFGLMQWQGSAPYLILVFVWGLCFPVLLFGVNGKWPSQLRSHWQ